MNGVEVLSGFKVYSDIKECLPKSACVTDLFIGGDFRDEFKTTSADVLNQTIDDCSRLIHDKCGLMSFHMSRFADKNQLTYWPFSQIVSKALHLRTL